MDRGILGTVPGVGRTHALEFPGKKDNSFTGQVENAFRQTFALAAMLVRSVQEFPLQEA